jgi:tRNA(adenine34) deaminase
MWKDISNPWKEAIRLAWEAYVRNTIPIGAVIVDNNGNVVAEGRNRIFDIDSSNPLAGTYMAHAEMTAMIQLKEKEHPNIRTYSMYTTMEPCPMCFGTMLMMHICDLKFGARDGFAGATTLKDTIEYIKKKTMRIERGPDELEVFQITLQSSFEYKRNHSMVEEVLGKWREYCTKGVLLGQELWSENYFDNAINANKLICEVYDYVIHRYNEL